MTDTITLKMQFLHEPSPRYYTAIGDFNKMKDAIKAAGGTFVSQPIKSWKVDEAILEGLKNAGYAVDAWPFLRMAKFNESTIYDQPNRPVTCDIYFEYITPDGNYRTFLRSLRVIVGQVTDQMVQDANAQINAGLAACGREPSAHLDRYTAVRKLAREAAEAASRDVIAAFEKASGGKRTGDAIKAGFEAITQMLDDR